MYSEILIRYGELMIKGKNRNHFIAKLRKRLKEVFPKETGIEINVTPVRAFLTLPKNTDTSDVVKKMQTIFGLSSISLAIKTTSTLEDIQTAALQIVNNELSENDTFKIDTKRSDKRFSMKSLEVTKAVAAYVFKNTDKNLKVDVRHPTKELLIEIRGDYTYVMLNKIWMPGGFPQGTSGKAALMLSGGIDSPVAAYLAMRKGIRLFAVHFASPPYTSEQALDKIKQLIEQLSQYQNHIPLYIVPFTEVQLAIVNSDIQEKYQMVVMRRLMYKITEQIARQNDCKAIINGESVGQVASQTLESMNSIHPVVDLPIIQPLATYEKNEIIKIAEQIGTYDISILPFEDCCTIFVPKSPVTRPTRHLAEKEENKINSAELITSALNMTYEISINQKQSEFSDFL